MKGTRVFRGGEPIGYLDVHICPGREQYMYHTLKGFVKFIRRIDKEKRELVLDVEPGVADKELEAVPDYIPTNTCGGGIL